MPAWKPIPGSSSTVLRAGDTMTGPLTLSGDPTQPLHAATRQYVLARIDALVNGAPGLLDTLGEIAAQIAADETVAGALATTVAGKASTGYVDAKPTIVIQQTQPTGAPTGSLWIKSNADGSITSPDQWQVLA